MSDAKYKSLLETLRKNIASGKYEGEGKMNIAKKVLSKGVLCALAGAASLAASATGAALAMEPFADGDRVVLWGDSITHAGSYVQMLSDFYLTRYPDRDVRIFNAGVGGDNAGAAMTRWEDDVRRREPTVVAVMFGMNDTWRDGLYAPSKMTNEAHLAALSAKERKCFEQYATNMTRLVERVQRELPKARMTIMTPTPYDETAAVTAARKVPVLKGTAAVLRRFSDFDRRLAREKGCGLVDWNASVQALVDARQAKNPDFSFASNDRVHPWAQGHLFMTYEFLKAQGVNGVVSDVAVSAADGRVLRSENATVSDFAKTDDGCSFVVLEKSLPWPILKAAKAALSWAPVDRELNRETLAVEGLAAGKRHALFIDGENVGEWTAEELAKGVELARNPRTPQFRQAAEVGRLNGERCALEMKPLRFLAAVRWFLHGRADADDLAAVRKYYDSLSEQQKKGYFEKLVPAYLRDYGRKAEVERDQEIRWAQTLKLRHPRPHRYELKATRASGTHAPATRAQSGSRYVFPRSYGRLTGFAFGNGHYVRDPGAFSLDANGHRNATSYDGFEFENGKAVVVGASAPITRVWWDPKTGEAGVACDEGAPFRFVESTNGLFAAAFEYRRRYPRPAAAGVKAKAGKFCVDVWNGTFRQQAEFVRRAAAELKITNDVFLCTHVWQRHGYDNGLPEVWPPDPAFGTAEDLKELARTCRENGWGFGVHHNVVDFYTNATCFAWADIARNERREPERAWRNAFRKTQSWRMAPSVAASYMRRSLDEMNAAGFSPDMVFVDVIGSFPAKPYFTAQGRQVGPAEARRQIGDVFETIREVQSAATGRAAFTASEAAHDYLVGRLDGGDCQWMEVTREPGEYCWNVIREYEDAEKIPWFDAVNHAVFSLHGAGYSIRYEAGRGELDHGIDSDDYLNAEILSGHALMTDCYSRDVRDVLSGTVRPLDMERCLSQLRRKWTLAQPVARELAGAEMTGHEFVGGDIHRQKVTWSTGMTVYANRGATDWTVEGVTLPPYGFLAVNPKTGVRAEISREKPRPRVFPKKFLDVTPEEIVRNPRSYQLHFWLAQRKPTENAVDYYDRLLTARDETPADAPKGVKLDRLVTVTDAGADPYDITARYYLNGVPSFDRRFYLKDLPSNALPPTGK